MDNYNKLTELYPFIKEIDKKQREQFIKSIQPIESEKGRLLIAEGKVCERVIFVLEGSIRIYKVSESGREITLYRIGPGETCIMTIASILGNHNFEAIAEVEENASLVILSAELFKELFSTNIALQTYVFNELSTKLHEVMLVLEEVAFKSMDQRIGNFLKDKYIKNSKQNIKITHEEIALELGTAREVVSRVLKDFQNRGLIKQLRGTIEILDHKKINIM